MSTRSISLFIAVLFISVFPARATAKDQNTANSYNLDYYGYDIPVHVMDDLNFPLPLYKIQLKGADLNVDEVSAALKMQFDLHPKFECTGKASHYIEFGVNGLKDNYGYTTEPFYKVDFNQLFPIKNPDLVECYNKCLQFLNSIGIKGKINVGYACCFLGREIISFSQIGDNEDQRIRILIPYDIDGLSTEYRNLLVNRNKVSSTYDSSVHILDYPFSVFVFNTNYQLLGVSLGCYMKSEEMRIDGLPITWMQAVTSALDYVMDNNPSRAGDSIEAYRDTYFSEYAVCVSRIFPLWLPDWGNNLWPGWCVQIHLYNSTDGSFLLAYELAVNALTGQVAK